MTEIVHAPDNSERPFATFTDLPTRLVTVMTPCICRDDRCVWTASTVLSNYRPRDAR